MASFLASDFHSYILILRSGINSPIVKIYITAGNECKNNLLIGGMYDGTVSLWNRDTGDLLGNFYAHSERIVQFFPSPSQLDRRFKSCLVCVGNDFSVSFINMDDLSLSFIFTHDTSISALHWRTDDDVLMVLTSDGLVHVWQVCEIY